MATAEMPLELLASMERAVGESVLAVERMEGGRNHRLDRLIGASGRGYVVKRDLVTEPDGRRRLEVEFRSLDFLWRQGVRNVPQPLQYDAAHGWALYSHLQGAAISPAAATDADIDHLVGFLGQLKTLRTCRESQVLPSASEACFSARALGQAIGRRMEQLTALPSMTMEETRLQGFLAERLAPAWHRLTARCEAILQTMGWSLASEVSGEARTLSPSDFGLHNALRQPNGQLLLVDFEYFGWDDPAKMIADTLLHPGTAFSPAHQRRFASGIFREFSEQPQLRVRVEAIWPLCGLNWCLILLNEFLPACWRRRSHASDRWSDRPSLLRGQLAQAEQMLDTVIQEPIWP